MEFGGVRVRIRRSLNLLADNPCGFVLSCTCFNFKIHYPSLLVGEFASLPLEFLYAHSMLRGRCILTSQISSFLSSSFFSCFQLTPCVLSKSSATLGSEIFSWRDFDLCAPYTRTRHLRLELTSQYASWKHSRIVGVDLFSSNLTKTVYLVQVGWSATEQPQTLRSKSNRFDFGPVNCSNIVWRNTFFLSTVCIPFIENEHCHRRLGIDYCI